MGLLLPFYINEFIKKKSAEWWWGLSDYVSTILDDALEWIIELELNKEFCHQLQFNLSPLYQRLSTLVIQH